MTNSTMTQNTFLRSQETVPDELFVVILVVELLVVVLVALNVEITA